MWLNVYFVFVQFCSYRATVPFGIYPNSEQSCFDDKCTGMVAVYSDEFEGPTCIWNVFSQEVVAVHRINAVSTWGALALKLERSLRVSNCLLRTYVMLLTWRVLHLSHSLFYSAFLLFPLCSPSTALFDVMARKTWRTDSAWLGRNRF